MSPTDSPKEGSKKWVPLPPRVLTKEEEERAKRDAKKDSKKAQGEIKGHKPRPSADSGFASATPYYEERSPDQYSPKSAKPQRRSADIQYYEKVINKSRPTKRRDREDGHVQVISADSAIDDEPKTQALEETHKALQNALVDTARYNYEAARDQEAKYQNAAATVKALEDELKRLTLQAQITEAKLAESDRQRLAAERKVREQEIEKELEVWRKEQRLREEEFDRRQNDEIENSPSPIGRGRRPPLVDQPKPPRRPSTLVTTNPFINVLDEARADYEIKKHHSTDNRRTERPRDDRRYT